MHFLFVNRARFGATDLSPHADQFVIQAAAMLANHEISASLGDTIQEPRRTEVPIGDPHFACRYRLQHLGQQARLLRMTVRAGKHVDRQHQRRIEHHQRRKGVRNRIDVTVPDHLFRTDTFSGPQDGCGARRFSCSKMSRKTNPIS